MLQPENTVVHISTEHLRKVQHWVNRALDIGVPGLMQEFRYNLAKWNPQSMTVDAFLANRDKNRYETSLFSYVSIIYQQLWSQLYKDFRMSDFLMYLDVPCQDQGRVTVKWPGLPNDYIHANYVAHPTTNNRFVCSQGPLDNTQLAFWAMVIQEKSEVVIMLCNTIECGKFKCSQYWPREKGETMTFGEGPGLIMVTNLDVRPMSAVDNFVRVCSLKLDYFENDKPKSTVIRHFQWENWPDRGVPPTKFTATNMLSEIRGTTKPIVVHCSAGIGRTGTIVAIAYVQERMNYGQYIYAHRVLLAYFLEKYRNRFAHILAGDGEAKYAKWREQYKEATGCD
ncbi:Protein-tyrosine phosphatase [Necator americanus]|uniref:Protein-tyrosine phosphatase n=1 Tax=Necator americanus TaxID=51031 RepID=W2SHR0_NECAM|nr:Protein-tyrosine phosphatase [Necator americanus]ETN69194.1 Protein-tyrosine phosphatase [Necator americanus]